MINYGKQFIDNDDIKAVTKILKSKFLTQGPLVNKFEKKLKNFLGSKYCCALSSGTAALHLAGLSSLLGKNDYVITSPISFVATSNSILYSNARPIFVDINKTTYNIDENLVEKKILELKKKNKYIKALIATDFAGNPCNWKRLKTLSKKYNFLLINDNCHALGARYYNDYKYAQKFADIVTHSFHPVKQITTGEGGALLTNNKKIFENAIALRSHGVHKNNKLKKKIGPWYYEMQKLGFNYRLTDFQSALGISQLKKLKNFLKKRTEIAKIYDSEFKKNPYLKIPQSNKFSKHAYHLYPLLINFKKIKKTKKKLFKYFEKRDIFLQVHYIPIHLQPYYKKNFKYKIGDFPVSEKFYSQEVSLPIYYSLKKKDVYKIIRLINNFVR